MILRLTDGTTTVNLTGGPFYRTRYVPKAPAWTTIQYEPGALANGGEVAAAGRRNVAESCVVTVTGADPDTVRGSLASVELLMLGAVEYETRRAATPVYVEYALEDNDDVYRSQIKVGTVQPWEEALSSLSCAASVELELSWVRRFYWEGPEANLTLINQHGSGTTGIAAYNHSDAGHDNFVDIEGSEVTGVLPAPMWLSVKNNYNVAKRMWELTVGHNVYSEPSDLPHILEAEDAISPAGAGTGDADCSGGEYKASNSVGTSSAVLMAWALSDTLLQDCRSRHFRLIMRVRGLPTGTWYVTPKITFPTANPTMIVAEGVEVQLDTARYLQDLGVMQIPPWLSGQNVDLYGCDLTLYARRASGTDTIEIDFVQLTPLDSFRRYTPRAYGAPYLTRVIDNGMVGQVSTIGWSGAQEVGLYNGVGLPILLIPGRDQRLYFLADNEDYASEIVREFTVQAMYRPRRVTL